MNRECEMGEEDLTVVQALWKKPGMTYQEIANLDGNRNRNRARQRLNRLVEHKFVEENGRLGWKKGKKLAYSLTLKGRREYFRSNSARAAEKIRILKEAVKGIDLVEALILLAELREYANGLVAHVEDVYNALPKNAELIGSTETEEERRQREAFYRETGGEIQVRFPSKPVKKRTKTQS